MLVLSLNDPGCDKTSNNWRLPSALVARIVVIGGGYAGLASSVRLAKLRHQVTLLEASAHLGGALVPITHEGFGWDGGPSYTLLPAVLRDLFRKSGRPAEKELTLQPCDIVREHRFEDGTSIRLTGGSRAGQIHDFDTLQAGLGQTWSSYVDSFDQDWEVLRRSYFETPWTRDDLPSELKQRLTSRETLHKRLKRSFKDPRQRLVAAHPFVADGHDPRNVPAWAGLVSYLEQRFGCWTIDGGMGLIASALTARLKTRGVTVALSTPALDLVVRNGRARAVRTASGEIEADHVVVAVDPRRLPALREYVDRTMPAIPPVVCHLGLTGDLPPLPHELVLHGDPMLVVRTDTHSETKQAWTLHGRGRLAEDIVVALARHKIDIRDQIEVRIDRSPRDQVEHGGGSPLGVLWQGRGTVFARVGPDTPITNVWAGGASATPGSGLPFVGLSAALVAQAITQAER